MSDATRTQTTSPDPGERRTSTGPTGDARRPCCGGPAATDADACCARDAEVKSAGGAGCGCGSAAPTPPVAKKTGCCG